MDCKPYKAMFWPDKNINFLHCMTDFIARFSMRMCKCVSVTEWLAEKLERDTKQQGEHVLLDMHCAIFGSVLRKLKEEK